MGEVLEDQDLLTNQLKTSGGLGEMLEGQDLLTNWPGTGGGLRTVLKSRERVAKHTEISGGSGTVLGGQPELLAGAVQLVVDKVGELNNKDAARREKLASMITVGGEGLSASEEYLIRQCVLEANSLFALSKDERAEVGIVEHDIDTGQSPPVRQAPHRVPFALHPVITQMVQDMLKNGILQESV